MTVSLPGTTVSVWRLQKTYITKKDFTTSA